jgi:monofunctional biosynthetic peptidoglycan transglycosylase
MKFGVELLQRLARGLALLLACLIALALVVQLWFAGNVLYLKHFNPDSTAFMRQRLSELRVHNPNASLKYEWVDYEKISAHLKKALVAAEDAKFVEHEGFDWEGIQAAMEKNESKGKPVAGGSTITQQLAKNLFLSPDKTYLRKGQEAVITFMLETMLDKERILELYINVIEWGDGVFGAQAAAQHYYKVAASKLNAPQAARLAAIVPAPRFYEKNLRSPRLRYKTNIILKRMGSAELPE